MIAAGVCLVSGLLSAQEQPAMQVKHPREATEWITSYAFNANSNNLPRVLLVGDSKSATGTAVMCAVNLPERRMSLFLPHQNVSATGVGRVKPVQCTLIAVVL